jgi:muconolactone delta-isomerase
MQPLRARRDANLDTESQHAIQRSEEQVGPMLFHSTGRFAVDISRIPDPTQENRVARSLVADGTIQHAWVHPDRSAVILVLTADSVAAAEAVIATLPFAADNTLVFETHEIAPLFPDAQ